MSIELLDALETSSKKKEPLALARVVRSPQPTQIGSRVLLWLDRPAQGRLGLGEMEEQVLADALLALAEGRHRLLRYPEHGIEVFVEVHQRPPRLLIVGAGHIAVPLSELGAICDFSVTVIDDRPQFASSNRFPRADEVIAADIRQTVSELATDPDTYVVLVTRGHSLDVECLLAILDRPLAYIGMIGSRRRVRAVFDLLEREQGIAGSKFERVYAPIGLAIGAETPAEIAVSIMAEIIEVRRSGRRATGTSRQQQPSEHKRQTARNQ